MELIIYWLAIPLTILFVTGPVAASVFTALLKKSRWRWLLLFWLGLGLTAVGVGVFITHTFANFYPGPGCFISLFTPFMVIMTFLFLRFRAGRVYQALGSDSFRRRWFIAGTLLIPLLQLSAPVISFGYGGACNALTQQAAQPIIAALESYKAETGGYLPLNDPNKSAQRDLRFLMPDYLSALPPRACTVWPFSHASDPDDRAEDDWSLYTCNQNPGREVLLMVPIIGSDSVQLYNFSTGHWSRGNWLDGYCDYLD
jgi:hypothetical protein